MKKVLSLLVLTTTLFITSGCGKKKQTKATPIEHTTIENNIVPAEFLVDTTTRDSKEDYTISA